MSCNGCAYRNMSTYTGCVGWNRFEPLSPIFNQSNDISKEMEMLAKYALNDLFGAKNAERNVDMRIKKVYFNNPVTVVLWEDDTKTIVRVGKDEEYDPEKGLAMAIAKKTLGNNGNYYEVFKQWLPEEYANVWFPESCYKDLKEISGEIKIPEVPSVKILTSEELAEKLGISKATINKRCRQGVYRGAVKVDGKWKIPYDGMAVEAK